MYLKKIDIKEFKKNLFKEYKKLFPREERKPYSILEKGYNNKITEIIEIVEQEQVVGFFITNCAKNNPYVQLDYFAILQEHQRKGYGSKAIKLLKEEYKDYKGIFIEIEKVGYGKNEKENETRQRRANFYERLGFIKMEFELDLFNVLYSAYILPCTDGEVLDENIVANLWGIYNMTLGETRAKKYCKFINP